MFEKNYTITKIFNDLYFLRKIAIKAVNLNITARCVFSNPSNSTTSSIFYANFSQLTSKTCSSMLSLTYKLTYQNTNITYDTYNIQKYIQTYV